MDVDTYLKLPGNQWRRGKFCRRVVRFMGGMVAVKLVKRGKDHAGCPAGFDAKWCGDGVCFAHLRAIKVLLKTSTCGVASAINFTVKGMQSADRSPFFVFLSVCSMS